MTESNVEIIPLIVVACAGVVIIAVILIVFKQIRARIAEEEEANARSSKKNQFAREPPVRIVTLSSSEYSSSNRRDGVQHASSGRDGRPAILRSPSDRLEIVNLWEFRKDQRRAFILENLEQQTIISTSDENNALHLPHLSVLSQRSPPPTTTTTTRRLDRKNDKNQKETAVRKTRGSRSRRDTISTNGTENASISISSTHNSPPSPCLSPIYMTDSDTQCADNDNYRHTACPICLEPYKEGDQVCWSRNEDCAHAYHLECKVSFLMGTDECSLCRINFLHGESRDTSAGRIRSSSSGSKNAGAPRGDERV